jgi:hypothetical protein
MSTTMLQRWLKAIDGVCCDGALARAGVTVASVKLPADRVGEYDDRARLIRIDERRCDAVKTLLHEAAHHLTRHLTTPAVWHGPEFQQARRDLELTLMAATLRARRRESEDHKGGAAPIRKPLVLPHAARPREYRQAGALSPQQQMSLIRAWQAAHPDEASIHGVQYRVIKGVVQPDYSECGRSRLSVNQAMAKTMKGGR